jgi:hypothetical protein
MILSLKTLLKKQQKQRPDIAAGPFYFSSGFMA